ncbi:conserved Plasmodium protein, unknown function [Plasmodium malariae]|uniref:Uncharacterized protein n=1 Tax=Plasmodium malariae TaxID=5858 RepID=A0A1D3SQB6_PLAMA|nr:conserved Plasmodium protein, unknown function [Plasmodium malariae]SCO94097.1 conserved Plasmodium protein, unknown function [Plasmodium malariae]
MKRVIIFVLATIFCVIRHHVGHCQMCTTDICEKCCHPTQNGCENNFYKTMRGNHYSDRTYCKLCECKNPITGCGWVAEKYEKVKCTSCTFIKHASARIKYFDICGCGYELKKGLLLTSS